MIKARNIQYIDFKSDLLKNNDQIQKMRKDIIEGDLIVVKNVVSKELIEKTKQYLTNLGRNSLPNYVPIKEGAPNFHRLNVWDERAYVKGCFHQFAFFPWNQDVFNFFEVFKEGFFLKNLINGLPKDKFLKAQPEDGCTARLSFQFYPKGTGGLNKHCDPVDHHQLTVPILIMSKKGVDFQSGGMYVENTKGEDLFGDDLADIGDVVLFNAQMPHGVKTIDESKKIDWLSFEGRWMMIFATNKLSNNTAIANAQDLEQNVKS